MYAAALAVPCAMSRVLGTLGMSRMIWPQDLSLPSAAWFFFLSFLKSPTAAPLSSVSATVVPDIEPRLPSRCLSSRYSNRPRGNEYHLLRRRLPRSRTLSRTTGLGPDNDQETNPVGLFKNIKSKMGSATEAAKAS